MVLVHRALRAGFSAALLAAFATTDLLVAQTVQAHYPLVSDLLDATGSYGPVTLTGNPTPPGLPSNGVCVNGIYALSANGQDIRTPHITSLNTSDFQIDVEFSLAGLPSFRAPVIMGGNGWRWIGIYVQSNGTVGIKHNNSQFTWSSTTLTTGTWYAAVLKYEAGTVQLFIDGALIHQAVIGPLNDGGNKNFTTNDYSVGANHNGCIRNLRIANDTSLGFNRVSTGCGGLTITEGGSPAQGGTVTLAIGGPFATAAIMFGFTTLNQPLCPPAPCMLGLVSVGSAPGATVSLPIPNTVPVGATVLFQGIALSPNGCPLGGSVNAAVTDTIQLVIQ